MPNTWDHQVRKMTADEIAFAEREQYSKCALGGNCPNKPRYRISWNYVTGRRGRVSRQGRDVCPYHVQEFVKKHDLKIEITEAVVVPPPRQGQTALCVVCGRRPTRHFYDMPVPFEEQSARWGETEIRRHPQGSRLCSRAHVIKIGDKIYYGGAWDYFYQLRKAADRTPISPTEYGMSRVADQ